MTPEELEAVMERHGIWNGPDRMSLKVWEQAVLDSAADVPALVTEVERGWSGMRQLLAQRETAEAALEDVRAMAEAGDLPGIQRLLVGEVDCG